MAKGGSPAPRSAPAPAPRPAPAPAPRPAPAPAPRPAPAPAASRSTAAPAPRPAQQQQKAPQQPARQVSASTSKPQPVAAAKTTVSSAGGKTQQQQKAKDLLASFGATVSQKEKATLIDKFGNQGKNILQNAVKAGGVDVKPKGGADKDKGKPAVTKTPAGTIVDLGDIESIFGNIMDVLGANQAETFNELEAQYGLDEQFLENQSNERLGEFNLQGVLGQAEATKYASEQAAGATRFASTESARGQIETQRVASESAERQIGLTGAQERLTAVTRGEQERLGITATGEEERKTVATTGEQQRRTQAELLAGQERQIGLTGEQERLTVGETARQQRETELQQELYRRFKEEKDYSQARAAFRA